MLTRLSEVGQLSRGRDVVETRTVLMTQHAVFMLGQSVCMIVRGQQQLTESQQHAKQQRQQQVLPAIRSMLS